MPPALTTAAHLRGCGDPLGPAGVGGSQARGQGHTSVPPIPAWETVFPGLREAVCQPLLPQDSASLRLSPPALMWDPREGGQPHLSHRPPGRIQVGPSGDGASIPLGARRRGTRCEELLTSARAGQHWPWAPSEPRRAWVPTGRVDRVTPQRSLWLPGLLQPLGLTPRTPCAGHSGSAAGVRPPTRSPWGVRDRNTCPGVSSHWARSSPISPSASQAHNDVPGPQCLRDPSTQQGPLVLRGGRGLSSGGSC